MVSIVTTQLCCCSVKAAIDSKTMSVAIPIKIHRHWRASYSFHMSQNIPLLIFFPHLLPFGNVKTNLVSLGCTKVYIGQFCPAGCRLQTSDLYKYSCLYTYKLWKQNFFPIWLAVIQMKGIFFFFLKKVFIQHLLINLQKQFAGIREDKNSLENVLEKPSHNWQWDWKFSIMTYYRKRSTCSFWISIYLWVSSSITSKF